MSPRSCRYSDLLGRPLAVAQPHLERTRNIQASLGSELCPLCVSVCEACLKAPSTFYAPGHPARSTYLFRANNGLSACEFVRAYLDRQCCRERGAMA
jgi:hypothetical protein